MRTRTLLLALVLAARAAPAQDVAALDRYVAGAMQAWKVPGLAIAVVRNDSVVLAKGYGVREVGKPDRVTEHTLFAIGSSTKAFTTALLGMLVDEGKLRWDDRAATLLPGFAVADPFITRELTLRDLVTHRADVARGDALWHGTTFGREEILRRARFLPSVTSFRTRFSYNNVMFLAAGEIAARAAGRSWDDLVRERIFAPLGMRTSTTSTRDLAGRPDVASPHVDRDGAVRVIPWRNLDNIAPAGAINSSAREMAEWVRLQLGGGTYAGRRLLAPGTVREMHTPQTIMRVEEWASSVSPIAAQTVPGTQFQAYGLGWFLQDYQGRTLVLHGGAIDGMRAEVAMLPSARLGVVILTNLDQTTNVLPEALVFRVLDAYLGLPARDWAGELLPRWQSLLDAGRAAVAARGEGRPMLPLEQYAGVYADSLYGEIPVRVERGTLVAVVASRTMDLEPWGYETFQGTERGGVGLVLRIQFAPDARGRPGRMTVTELGEFRRVSDRPGERP